jgi:hypothetical protein
MPGRTKFTIGQAMGVIALIAVVLALIPAPFSIMFLIVLLVLAVTVSVIAARTAWSWITVAAWLSSLYPFLLLSSLDTTWLTAWFVLGHRPRPSPDDPKFISPLVSLPHGLTWSLIVGFGPALAICIILVLLSAYFCISRERDWAVATISRFVVPPLLWLSAFGLLGWDPGRVVYWFMD